MGDGGLTVFPEVLDEAAGGVVQQGGHVVVQRIHVLRQPISCIIVHLQTEIMVVDCDFFPLVHPSQYHLISCLFTKYTI